MREEQNDYYLKRYGYSGFNRMEMSDIINYRDNTHVITDYRYDSFGRRIHTAERTKTGMRTIYDGLSFEVVKEGETFLGTRGITSSATGEANLNNYNPHGSDHTRGTRYYFIRDRGQELRTGKNGEALPDRTKRVRTYLYLNGERVAVNNLYNTNHGQYYYGSDLLGSVKFVTGGGGQEVRRIEYDAFGGIYKGNSPYGLETGYTGKPYDAVTGLSDYGFRDYSSAHARFITEDPIRDGENWFAYVGNNPVNWVDPDGRITVTMVATGFGVLYVGYKYATDAQLREDTGELIKTGVKATVDTVKWTGKTVAKGAQWAGEKISEGVSAAKDYFSKGKKVRDKENHAIPPGNQNSQQRQGNELKPEKPNLNNSSGGNNGKGVGIIATITIIIAKCSEVQQNTEESLRDLKTIAEMAQQQTKAVNVTHPPMFEQGQPVTNTPPQNNKGK